MLLNREPVGNDLAQAETQRDLGSAVGSTSVMLLRFSPLAGCLLTSRGFELLSAAWALLKAVVAYKGIGKKGSRVRVPDTAQVSCVAQSTGCNSSKRHLEYCTPQAEAGGWPSSRSAWATYGGCFKKPKQNKTESHEASEDVSRSCSWLRVSR